METKILAAGALFLLKIATGLWLMKSGRPYSSILLTFHKLIALGTLAVIISIVQPLVMAGTMHRMEMVGIISTGVFFLAAIATGGLISTKKTNRAAGVIHKLASGLALFVAIVTVASLAGKI